MARARFCSKINLTDAYEQVRIQPEDIEKTAFSTVAGTYISKIMQQGDCNAPATFQQMMTAIFKDAIGDFLHIYLDDNFICSDTEEDHDRHFHILRENKLYLKWSKCDLYSKRMDCLGHIIDDNRIHPAHNKLNQIVEWRTPRNYNNMQKFVGLVNYLAPFLPNISAYTGPLMAITQNGTPFHWRPLHKQCFKMVKRICTKSPILKPINPHNGIAIWVICDASKTGIGSMYGQGNEWTKCCPAGFMLRRFTSMQQNYTVHELETLAILEALHRWEDKLMGYRIHVVTDHKALEFFKTQIGLTPRQHRWYNYLSRFNFDITYVKGESNKVADCLSRYYKSDKLGEKHHPHEYVHADIIVNPEADDLPKDQIDEIHHHVDQIMAMEAKSNVVRKSTRLQEKRDKLAEEANELMGADTWINKIDPSTSKPDDPSSVIAEAGTTHEAPTEQCNPTLDESISNGSEAEVTPPPDEFLRCVQHAYNKDILTATLLKDITELLRSATICSSRFYLSVYSCMRFTYSCSL
jgi:hypothetical protein